jgi:oligo-1,6-glucosidase
MTTLLPLPWWKQAVFYQVYPKSFRDVNGDGVGDIRGITEKLPYLADLGVGALWLSPIFASPMIDNGYDVSDYKAINPLFGAMDDALELFEEARKRNLKVVLDIALNHASTQHPWFQNAIAGGDKRDWFWFREGRCGAPPNNWKSIFGGPAWSRADNDDEFYLHLFDKSQADLNWENPAVRAEIYESMRFWLDKGAGGFRLDVVTVISKEPDLRDVADTRLGPFYRHLANGPRLHEYLREMRREVFTHYDCVAIGEAPGVDAARAATLVDPADPMLDMIYHFDLVEPKRLPDGAWDRAAFKTTFQRWDEGIGPRGWNSVVISNHDLARVVSRFGDDQRYRFESATMLATLLLTQRATPFIYQGDELGLVNCPFDSIEEIDDIWAKNLHAIALAEGKSAAEAFTVALSTTRDHARTPFPWDDRENFGFTNGATPWLKPNPLHRALNGEAQMQDDKSVRAFVKRLIALRQAEPLWLLGATTFLPCETNVFAYTRAHENETRIIVLNLGGEERTLPEVALGQRAIGNYAEPSETLRPWEAVIFAP